MACSNHNCSHLHSTMLVFHHALSIHLIVNKSELVHRFFIMHPPHDKITSHFLPTHKFLFIFLIKKIIINITKIYFHHHTPHPPNKKVLKEVRSKGCTHNSISDMLKIHFQLLRLSRTHNSTPR